jgi:hypothetical protein
MELQCLAQAGDNVVDGGYGLKSVRQD